MAAYVLEGPRWGTGAAGTGGGTVTWAMDSSVPAAFVSEIQAAFADWSAHANISFQQVASTAGAEIRFSDSYIDGLDKTLGETTYTYSGQTLTWASVTFDSGEGWHTSGSQVVSADGVNLYPVALHEIGHSLGLDHYNAVPAVMNAVLNPSVTDLTASDISGIQALYGGAVDSTTSDVAQLYYGLLGRAPDAVGLQSYTDAVKHGTSLHDVAQAFLDSAEFQLKNVAPSNAAFVDELYVNAMGRHAEPGGLQYWQDALAHGASQADVALGIAENPEAHQHLASSIEAGWHLV
jgi:matrixin/uncharacterized protein DUF4214